MLYSRSLQTLARADVIVAGGGSSGCVAALAAARAGANTILIEKHGFFGGIGTAVLDTFYGFYTPGGETRKVVGGTADLVVNELVARDRAFLRPNVWDAGGGVTYCPETLKVVYDAMLAQAGVRVMLHTFVTDIIRSDDGRRVLGVVVDGKAGLGFVGGTQIIDATGDADVCFRAETPIDDSGDHRQALTTTLRIAGVDLDRARRYSKQDLKRMICDARATGNYRIDHNGGDIHRAVFRGGSHAAFSRVAGYDATDPQQLSMAEIEGRRQSMEMLRLFRECIPGYENAELVAFGAQIGVRETRRIVGDYVLTLDDVLSARKFSDSIGQCGAPAEYQEADGVKVVYIPDSGAYDIPFRSLLPVALDNVLVAGRSLSATHEAQASCRSIGQCMAMGQAAGTAAALCSSREVDPRDLNLTVLQAELVANGAILYDDQQTLLRR